MPARGEVHAEDGITRLEQCEEDALVRLAARVRLHIGKTNIEEFTRPLNGEVFGDIHMLAPAIIALARMALETMFSDAISSISCC
jgi:hypothetical protein